MKTFTNCAEKKAKQFLNLLQGYTKGIRMTAILVLLLMGVSNAWGETNTTVYYAVPTSVVGSYTVKCNVNYKGDGTWWEQHNMTKTDKTYDGYPIYSCTFTDKYDGLGCLQFQLYNGNNHVSQQQPIGSWTSVSTYNGKLLKHDQAGWNTYRYDQHGFEAANNGIKYYSNVNANDEEWNFNGQSAQTKELGEVTTLYLKEWFVQLYENWAGAQGNIKFQYNIHPTANSAGNYTEITKKWEDLGNWNNGWLYPKYGNNEQNINLLNGLPGSGKYTMSFKYYDSDLKLTSPVHKLNWTYNIVPSVNNFTVTVSRENIVSGTGTNGDPYVIACGKTITLTVSGSKASTDANSSLYAKFGSDAYTSTLTKTLTPSSTKQSVPVKAKYYNSKDNLSGAETTTQTIYYRAQTFAVNITSSGNGTVSPSSSQQVGSTSVTIKATANTGYKFKNWTTTGGVVIADANDATTTITATADGTVKANFEEDLSSNWKLIGDNQNNSPFGDNYTYSNGKAMTKKSGHSTESNVYITLDIKHLPASYYGFKVATSNSDDQKYGYGQGGGDYIEFNRLASNSQKQVYSGSQHELKFIPDALGEYEFRVNYPSNKYVYVTFPTAYAVTFGPGIGGSSVTAKYNSTSFNTGTKVQSGKTVTFTQTASAGYTFKEWNTKSDGTGTKLSTNATYTRTVAATNTVYAIYTKKPDKTIYLEPTGYWNGDKAVFQAHVWQTGKTGVNLKMEGIGDPSHADGDNKSPYKYYKVEVPAEYDNILFFRKDNFATANENAWNKTGDLTIPADNNVLYTITSAGKGKAEGYDPAATGTWKAPNFVYTITLGYCDFGTYGIKYNGQSYFSKPKENVTVDVPAGAQIEILEGQPFSNAYTGDVIKAKPTKEELTGQTLTINGDITLDDNFKTKERHVVYLGVLETLDNWQLENNQTYYIWRYDSKGSISMTAADEGSYVFTKDGIKYYRFTIAAGCNSYRFERKDKDSFTGTTHACSEWLDFQIPLTDVNCFTLKDEKDDKNRYKGTWGVLPAQPGDYRLLYVEQVVEKSEKAGDEWKTIITRKKAHPSNIIRKGTARQIVSLHTYKDRTYMANAGGSEYESSNNPEIILQKYLGNDQWQDVECQMVYGPLETLPIMANLPGRKNASPGSNIDDLQHQDGIEIIKQDVLNHPDEGNGVWNFVVTQDGDNASVQWDQTHRYTGEYYIRTDNAEGGWDQYTLNDNYMTYSQYAKDHSGFSHYFCRWVEVSKDDNTKFVIANDYGVAISDTLAKDDYTNEHGDIAHDANIRWSWNMVNNEIARAYIQGTWEAGSQERNRNLVVNYKSSSTAADQEDLLDDSGDWIYQKDFTVKVGSHLNSLTAKYPVTSDKTQTFASNLDMLTGSSGNTNDYKVRVLYDFKINKTLVALVPNANEASIAIDVIIERVDQGGATQVQSGITRTVDQGATVYAVMSFTKTHIKGDASKYAKQFYWISFPFDVRISEVFGFGEYGKHWIIQWYDGAERAKNGCWIDSPTYWRFQTDTTDYFLEAGKGYVLTLDLDQMDVFTNTNQVSLYFPSTQKYKSVDGLIINDLSAVTLEPYTCTIQRNDRWIKDSHWHMLGVPSFANKGMNFTQDDVAYFYQYNSNNDTYTPTSSGSFNFNSMFSYMVQFAGTINWNEFSFTANGGQGLAAKKNANEDQDKHSLRLELQKNNSYIDQTFVQLQTEAATEMFDMNLDLTKMMNSGANIYSIIQGTESNIEVAGNVLPVQETIIPVGVVISAAGEYTFAMPDGTDGIVVELIDYETNTRTNMLLDEYSINLGKGTFENRFALHVKPNKTTTSLVDVNTNTTGVKKYLIDGILYMQKDGALYDAQGKLVR